MKHVKTCAPKDSLMLHRTLAEPYLRYCNSTWGKWRHLLLSKLQALQNRAARVVMGIKSRMDECETTCYDTAFFMYKITKGTAPEYTQSEKFDATHLYNTRLGQNGNVITPEVKSAKGQTPFVYSCAHMWNNLLSHLKEAQPIDIFQERPNEHILTNDL